MALRERLAALNPARTVRLNGAQRPAVVVLENELPNAAELAVECFYLTWGHLQTAGTGSGRGTVCAMECSISYCTRGTVQSGVDRGRVLGEMDRELYMICQPAMTGKRDFTQAPNVDLGTGVFWTLPSIGDANTSSSGANALSTGTYQDPTTVGHEAKLTVFFFPEVESL